MSHYHDLLGIKEGCGVDDVNKAFKKLAVKHHPDKNPDDLDATKKFQELSDARDNALKIESGEFQWDPYSDLNDVFNFNFRYGSGVRKAPDIMHRISISLEDAYKGKNYTLRTRDSEITIQISPGVMDGQIYVVKGRGVSGPTPDLNGDLHLIVSIKNHPKLNRVGNNLYLNEDVDYLTMILGGEILVECFDKKYKVKIPPLSQNQDLFKLKGKGFPFHRKGEIKGDFIIKVNVKLPVEISNENIEILKKLKSEE